jgi:(1->4)-alpha-D-glucan 1-alpha-D-glucosylmutase
MLKASREAKARTSWSDPDPGYEAAVTGFVDAVLQPADDAPFLADVARLVSLIAPAGAWNALSRIAIHLTSPGTPDIYQGDEFWNFALVDPDNRRLVDYEPRAAAAAELAVIERGISSSAEFDPNDNRLKLYVTARLLDMRRNYADLFALGSYRQLAATGTRAGNVIAFAREFAGQCAITIAARLTTTLDLAPSDWWADTTVALPPELKGRCWQSQIVPGRLVGDDSVNVGGPCAKLPMIVGVG